MRYLLLICTILVGCGPDSYAVLGDPLTQWHEAYQSGYWPDEMTTDFHPPCSERVHSAHPFSPKAYVSNLFHIRRLFAKNGLVPEGKFCVSFSGIGVTIEEEHTLDGRPGISGVYSPTKGIFLGKDGVALAHELLHAWEYGQGNLLTILHVNWGINGYKAVQREYLNFVINLVPEIAAQQEANRQERAP